MQAAQTRAVIPLCKRSHRTIFLSGTPALAKPSELFPQLQGLLPSAKLSRTEFASRYCIGDRYDDMKVLVLKQTRRRKLARRRHITAFSICVASWNAKACSCAKVESAVSLRRQICANRARMQGSKNEDELFAMLTNTVMVRRLKQDVLSGLPKKERNKVRSGLFMRPKAASPPTPSKAVVCPRVAHAPLNVL